MPKIIIFPFRSYLNTPIGVLEIEATQTHIHTIRFLENDDVQKTPIENKLTQLCVSQLTEYFSGKRTLFELPTQQDGTEFQHTIWKEVSGIAFGKTLSYLMLAKKIGSQHLTRAVGNANSQNKIAIIIPCHRVIASNGNLTGYAWGLQRKQWLLDHEAKVNNTYTKLF